MTEPANGHKRKQAEALLYDLHEIVWDDAVSMLMEMLGRAEAAEKRMKALEEEQEHDLAGADAQTAKAEARAEAAEKRVAVLEDALHNVGFRVTYVADGTAASFDKLEAKP